MWTYAWILPVTVGSCAIATNVIVSGAPRLGGAIIAFALAVLLVAVLHDYLTRFDRRHAYYSIDGDKVTRQFTYPQFRALPDKVRQALMADDKVERWYEQTIRVYVQHTLETFDKPAGKMRHRARKWFLAFLRGD